jgi:hypothetical protein
MDICDCIKQLDLSGGITTPELERFPCLETCICRCENCPEYIKNQPNPDKLILVLFRAVQELKNEIDILKAI